MNTEELKVLTRMSPDTIEYIKGLKLVQVAQLIKATSERIDEVGEIKTDLQKVLDHLTLNVAPSMMEDQGIDRVVFDGVGRLQLKDDIYCNVSAADREALKEWLVANGHSSLISDTVNASSLKAFIKEQMKAGADIPADLVKVTPFTKASVVKA